MQGGTPRLLLLALVLAPAAAPAQVDQSMVDALAAEVRPAVAKATGVALDAVGVRVVVRGELRKALEPELALQSKALGIGEAQARTLARSLANMLLGKFRWGGNEILICPRNFDWQARALEVPALREAGAVRAILVHEFVHAAAEKQHGWSRTLASLESADRLIAFNAVIEGHAQHVAAKICEAHGWGEGFATYTSTLGKTEPDAGAGERLLAQAVVANIAAAYLDGRRFIAFLEKKLGEKGIARAYAEPPADFASVLNPEWYLDPARRPARSYDFDAPLRKVAAEFREEWLQQRVTITTPQLRAAFAMLPGEDVDRVVKHLKANDVLVLNDRKRPGARLVVFGLYEFDSPQGARYFVAASERLARLKDEKLKEGSIRILDAAYEQLAEESLRGVHFTKTVAVGWQQSKVASIVAARGAVGVELLYSNEPVTRARLEEQARAMLEGVFQGEQASTASRETTSRPARDR